MKRGNSLKHGNIEPNNSVMVWNRRERWLNDSGIKANVEGIKGNDRDGHNQDIQHPDIDRAV